MIGTDQQQSSEKIKCSNSNIDTPTKPNKSIFSNNCNDNNDCAISNTNSCEKFDESNDINEYVNMEKPIDLELEVDKNIDTIDEEFEDHSKWKHKYISKFVTDAVENNSSKGNEEYYDPDNSDSFDNSDNSHGKSSTIKAKKNLKTEDKITNLFDILSDLEPNSDEFEMILSKLISLVRKQERDRHNNEMEKIIVKEKKKMLDQIIDMYPPFIEEKAKIIKNCIEPKREEVKEIEHEEKKITEIVLTQFEYNDEIYYKYKKRIIDENAELVGSIAEEDDYGKPIKCIFFKDKPRIGGTLESYLNDMMKG